jgi:Tripartite tricarboxylate transporter family receptor
MNSKFLLAVGLISAFAATPTGVMAQFYKGKTITLLVNYPVGGPTDIEARLVAQHLPDHIPGTPIIVVKNVGGAGGILGSNQVGRAEPDGETLGYLTQDMPGQLLGNPAIQTNYSDFVLVAGIDTPLVVYMRKDTPPGITVPTDLMKTKGFKALSLTLQNPNTICQDLALDLLGLKYQPVPAYRGLRDVETAILQDIGQLANSSLAGWRGSVEATMREIVIPLFQLAPPGPNNTYPRSKSLPNLQTFEEFYATVRPGETLAGNIKYRTLRTVCDPQLAMFRAAVFPPKTSDEAVATMRVAFAELWKSPDFVADYVRVIKTEPTLVSGAEGQQILTDVGKPHPEIKAFLLDYLDKLLK